MIQTYENGYKLLPMVPPQKKNIDYAIENSLQEFKLYFTSDTDLKNHN